MSAFEEKTLAGFLSEQSTNFKSGLPLVHTTDAGNILQIITENRISVTKCDTFTSEQLAYFFHGRPSYRKFREQPMEWELPFVLIMKNTCLMNIRRVFPFDSGAFHSNRLPSYITDFGDNGYELATTPEAIDILIDIFFGGDTSYFHGSPKPKEEVERRCGLNIRHSRIKALSSLYNREQSKADDRALAFEVQTDQNVSIADNIIGAILPRPYFDDRELRKYFKSKKITIRHYDVYPINTEGYMNTIYTEVKYIYARLGHLNE